MLPETTGLVLCIEEKAVCDISPKNTYLKVPLHPPSTVHERPSVDLLFKSHMELDALAAVQLLSRVRLFATPWTAAHPVSLSFTISQSFLKLMSIELVMLSSHLILWAPSPFAFSLSQPQGLFQRVSSSHLVAKRLELQLQHQSF